MPNHRLLVLAVSVFALTACNPFRHDSAVEVTANCGADEGVFGAADSYQIAKLGSDGHATSSADVAIITGQPVATS